MSRQLSAGSKRGSGSGGGARFSEVLDDGGTGCPMDVLDAPSLNRCEVNQLIMEYLVMEGYKDAAEKFADETGLPLGSTRLGSIDERMEIREAVMDRRIDETIDRVNRLWPELFDKNPIVYFQLRQTQMLELIRARELEKALDFAQRYLSDLVDKELSQSAQDSEIVRDLENTMSLLAFDQPADSIYGQLLEESHVEKVAGKLNRAILREESDQNEDLAIPRLTQMMGMLLFCKNALHLSNKVQLKELWPTDD